jgi:hypothetical protein
VNAGHTAVTAQDPLALLEDIRHRHAAQDVPVLLAVVGKLLEPHQPGPFTILGSLCGQHANHRYFSITGSEAANIGTCLACSATVYTSCSGCGPHVAVDRCPVRSAAAAVLRGAS